MDPPNFTRVARLAEFGWGKCVMAATMSPRAAVHDITQGLDQPRTNPQASAVETLFETYVGRSPANCRLVTLFTVTRVTNKYLDPAAPAGKNDAGAGVSATSSPVSMPGPALGSPSRSGNDRARCDRPCVRSGRNPGQRSDSSSKGDAATRPDLSGSVPRPEVGGGGP
jgi:hypothetical protein